MKAVNLLLGILIAFSPLCAAAFETNAKFRDIRARLVSHKPLAVGTNSFELSVSQSAKPLDNATVKVKIFMPSMPGMPYMESVSDTVAAGKGLYRASVNLPMGGTWQVHIFITTPKGKKYRLKTSLNF